MARVTTYLAFVAGRGAALKADKPVICKSADDARRKAERMASSKLGVVAYATSGDADLGEYDEEPVYLVKMGQLPVDFE